MSQLRRWEEEGGGTTGGTRTWTHREWAAVRTIRNSSLTPVGREYRNRCDGGDSWILSCVFHLHMLDSSFLSIASFCFSQWFEVCVSTQYYYILAPFSSAIFSVLYGMAFICFSSSSLFFPQLVPGLFLHKFILLAGHYVKYCGNRMFLWYIIQDRVRTADLLAFSPGKKGEKKVFPLHVCFRWIWHQTEVRWCSDHKYPPKLSFFSGWDGEHSQSQLQTLAFSWFPQN